MSVEMARVTQNGTELETVKSVARSAALTLIFSTLVFMVIAGFYVFVVILTSHSTGQIGPSFGVD